MKVFRMAAVLLPLVAAPAWSQSTAKTYRGELSCGPLLNNPAQAGWTAPLQLQLDGGTLLWQRGDATYEETGRAAVQASGPTRLTVLGRWHKDSGRSGEWGGTVALNIQDTRISGTMVQTSKDGAQRFRDCSLEAQLSAGPQAASRGTPLLPDPGGPRWKDAPAYDARHAATVLRRSVFFMPVFGAVYREKFETLLNSMPATSLRGVVIYNHGCGGQLGWETTVAQYFYRWGFAVITPDFLGREGNKSGCPGGSGDDMLNAARQRANEGIYQAINPARLAARGQDIQTVIEWVKRRTALPIILSGHSEGCRAIYAMHVTDPQVVGGACVKQGLQPNYAHTWRWNTQKPMWQSLEESDPWVVSGGLTVAQVSFAPKFHDNPAAHTLVVVPGNTHDPLNHDSERVSLRAWLDARVAQRHVAGQNGVDYEAVLPALHNRMQRATSD